MSQASLIEDLDTVDRKLLQTRIGAYLERSTPQVGDFVRFADGVERRISYVWQWEGGPTWSVQTSDGGSFYLADGYCSFSGSLYTGIPYDSLELTGTLRRGSCWFFHHDHRCADNGVDVQLPIFNEWTSSLESGR